MRMHLASILALSLLVTPALAERSAQPRTAATPAWAAAQATGKPDVPKAGDHGNAWATLAENAGVEWIELSYAREVRVTGVRVFENLSPGAVTKISARVGEQYVDLWTASSARGGQREGCPKAPEGARYAQLAGGICMLDIEVSRAASTDTIRVWLDTRRVAGWNEIDAVELVGTARGEVVEQWATGAWASTSYASGAQPLAPLVGAKVRVRLLNRDEVKGTLRAVSQGFLEVEALGRVRWVPLSAVATVERD